MTIWLYRVGIIVVWIIEETQYLFHTETAWFHTSNEDDDDDDDGDDEYIISYMILH